MVEVPLNLFQYPLALVCKFAEPFLMMFYYCPDTSSKHIPEFGALSFEPYVLFMKSRPFRVPVVVDSRFRLNLNLREVDREA